MTSQRDFNADFFVTTATVIPVIFLALVIDGGLWAWIAKQISSAKESSALAMTVVSLLQGFSLLILGLGLVSEILALYVLLLKISSTILQYVVFASAAFLVMLLGLALSARIPGLLYVSGSGTILELENGEQLNLSGRCSRLLPRVPSPWIAGVLFITNFRVVWKSPASLGILGARSLEIRRDGIMKRDEFRVKLPWIMRNLPDDDAFTFTFKRRPAKIFSISDLATKTHWFYSRISSDDFREYIEPLTLPVDKTQPDKSDDGAQAGPPGIDSADAEPSSSSPEN